MKMFTRPDDSWLSIQSFDPFNYIYQKTWEQLESLGEGDAFDFVQLQNEGLLMRLFLEQSLDSSSLASDNTLSKVIQRDFQTPKKLKEKWMLLAGKIDVQWIVVGLSFVDFKFHLFPITTTLIPFSLSPIMVTCFTDSLLQGGKLDRQKFALRQWENINWKVVEQRIVCLSEPLDLFEEMVDCADESCQKF